MGVLALPIEAGGLVQQGRKRRGRGGGRLATSSRVRMGTPSLDRSLKTQLGVRGYGAMRSQSQFGMLVFPA